MNEMLAAAKGLNAADDIKQDNADLMADVSKLVNITEMLVESFSEFIHEVHVSPMNIVQLLMNQVKVLKFFIVYDASHYSEDIKSECEDTLMELVKSEFDGVDSYEPTVYSMYNDWSIPTLLLYSKQGISAVDEIDGSSLLFINSFLECTDAGAVSIPSTYMSSKCVNMFVHAKSVAGLSRLRKSVENFSSFSGREMKEVGDTNTSIAEFNIVYMVGLKPLQYNIPYLYIDHASIDSQRIEQVLNSSG